MRRAALIVSALVAALVFGVVETHSSRGDGGPYNVRAIFDDAAFAVPGEQVRIAGAPVGSVQSLDVTPTKKAAVTLEVDNAAFTPFYANASCAIRPQSLIAERYVDCTPGSSSQPALQKINSGPGAGSYLLPVTQTHSPVDSDIVQDISTQPMRERLTIILSELGTGLAARGADLNAVIRRANPALGNTDKVLKILAHENRVLARLATDSDAVLVPLARARASLAGFVVHANTTSVAAATRAADEARSFQLLPSFLRQLQPLMVDLGQLADQGTPLMTELGQSASAVSRQFENLTPFAKAARPALIDLGNALQASQPKLLATQPLAHQLDQLGTQAEPAASLLNKLTASLDVTGGIEQLMKVLFFGTSAANAFDATGHYVRAQGLVGDCTGYALVPATGCSANFYDSNAAADIAAAQAGRATAARVRGQRKAARAQAARAQKAVTQAASRVKSGFAARRPNPDAARHELSGLLKYLIGSGQ